MKKFTKSLALLLAFMMVFGMLAACSKSEPTASTDANTSGMIAPLGNGKDIYNEPIKIARIAISTAGITNILINLTVKEQLLLYPNVTVDHFDGNYDVTTQIQMIQEAVTQGYDAIIMDLLDIEACNNAILEAEAAGVPVITMNSGATALHTLHLQGSDYESGQIAARKLIEMTGGVGNAVILDVPAELKAIGQMGTGFQETVEKESDIVVLELQAIDFWSQEIGRTKMSDLLTKYPDIDMVYCASDDIAIGAIQAIEAAGRQGDDIKVWGNCAFRNALDAITEGRMTGSCYSDVYLQYGMAVYFALFFIQTGTTSITAGYTETPSVDQAMIPVTIENVEDIKAISHWYRSDIQF